MRTGLILDTLEMALLNRKRGGLPVGGGLIHHHDNGTQYLSFAFTQRLLDAGVDAFVGSVGDALDHALAEANNQAFNEPGAVQDCSRPPGQGP